MHQRQNNLNQLIDVFNIRQKFSVQAFTSLWDKLIKSFKYLSLTHSTSKGRQKWS